MTNRSLVLSAYNGVSEWGRIERLADVAKQCPPTVTALHDHKGLLSVNWQRQPTPREMAKVIQAWADQCEYAVNHYVRGRVLHEEQAGGAPWCHQEVVVMAP
jgi:hypothetical protein